MSIFNFEELSETGKIFVYLVKDKFTLVGIFDLFLVVIAFLYEYDKYKLWNQGVVEAIKTGNRQVYILMNEVTLLEIILVVVFVFFLSSVILYIYRKISIKINKITSK